MLCKPNPSITARLARGKSLRKDLPRAKQGDWQPSSDRPDPIATLQGADSGRVADLLPIKYGRMAASPFGFFRGAAPVMARDLSALPRTGLLVQLCGDAHIRNLGAFASAEGNIVFDINDFDETIAGPWEWDMKRLATSFVLAGRESGTTDRRCRDGVAVLMESYRSALSRFALTPFLDLARHRVGRELEARPIDALLRKAERSTPLRNLQKLTTRESGGIQFANRPPLLQRLTGKEAENVLASLPAYRGMLTPERRLVFDAYRPADVALKVVGTGSVGTRDYVVLMFGIGEDDPLFLQIKQEMHSCYAPFLDEPPAPHDGQRVADGQLRTQMTSDPLLGWTSIDGNHYLVRQLADHKSSIEPQDLSGSAIIEYARVCGEVFAHAHARTGDAAALAGYCGKLDQLDQAMTRFAIAYADAATADHALMKAAIRSRRLVAATV
ncbi:MAG TPA: DUF2252 domain-containing protein [Thermoanaerobaculia bacterium]|nr:DUF2252 domain-containing protein [Thermoanaerobaculia bacterium]